MTEIVISCPKCSRQLKLRDRSKLGKKARCPKCQNIFFMTAPPEEEDEVELQLAGSPDPAQPAVGVGARWVPDNAAAPPTPVPAPGGSQLPAPPQQPAGTPAAPVFETAPQPSGGLQLAAEDQGGAAQLKAIRQKAARRRNLAIAFGILTACALGGAIYAARDFSRSAKEQAARDAAPKRDEETASAKEELEKTTAIANAASPTSGEKLRLNALPMGAQMLINLRPAELWAEGTKTEEVRYCLGPLGVWAGEQIRSLTNREPAEIEQMIIAVIPGEVGEPADTAAVFQLKEEAKKSQLLLEFGGDRSDEFGYPVYLGDERSYLIKDLKTIAVCPTALAQEMAQSVEIANPQNDGVDAMIHQSDADRHLTVIFNPRSMARHRDTIFPEVTWKMIDRFTEFFNDEEIETVLWSFHFDDRKFFSEILMRNRGIIKEHLLHREMQKKLRQAPYDIWHMVEKMNPTVIGHRKIIGRFPAMTQVFAKSTIGGKGSRFAQLVTSIDERAAPNLALGALLTWDESTRTDFSKAAPVKPIQSGPKLPDLIADRLKTKVEVEFNRTPLQEAFAFIAEECKTGVDIDGDALKDKGYTKNMAQTFSLNKTGMDAIKAILDRYESMCVVIQEDKKQFLITTESFAAKNGQKVFYKSAFVKE